MSTASPRRTKVAANPTPQSIADVEVALCQINAHRVTLTEAQAALDNHVQELTERNRRHAAPIRKEIERLTKGIQSFCEANRSKLTKGKSKSVKFANGTVSWRRAKASVVLNGDEADIIATIRTMKLLQFLRVLKPKIDKAAMLKHPAQARTIPGVSITDGVETFAVEE